MPVCLTEFRFVRFSVWITLVLGDTILCYFPKVQKVILMFYAAKHVKIFCQYIFLILSIL